MQTPFCMPECAKTYLQQSRISKFSGGGPPDPPLQGEGREGEGREEREGKGKGRREGKDREGRGPTGRDREGKEGRNGWGEGTEGRSTWAPPLETSSGSAPGLRGRNVQRHVVPSTTCSRHVDGELDLCPYNTYSALRTCWLRDPGSTPDRL